MASKYPKEVMRHEIEVEFWVYYRENGYYCVPRRSLCPSKVKCLDIDMLAKILNIQRWSNHLKKGLIFLLLKKKWTDRNKFHSVCPKELIKSKNSPFDLTNLSKRH